MAIFIILICSSFFLLMALFLYSEHKKKVYFESRGVLYTGNTIINGLRNIIMGVGMIENFSIQYRKTKAKNMKIAGSSGFGRTTLIVQDPELLKLILVKDFDNFADRSGFKLSNNVLFRKMLVAVQAKEWRALRSRLSPTFTTGKIKRLFGLFDQSGKKLVKYLEQEVSKYPNSEMDIGEGYSKFTMDIIASAVCGIDSQAFNQKEPSLFERMGMKLQFNLDAKALLKLLISMTMPKLGRLFGHELFDKEAQDFFKVVIKSSIHDRQEKNEKRNDFLQLMLETRENKLKIDEAELDTFEKDAMIKEQDQQDQGDDDKASVNDILDDDGIVANAVLFMIAGYDTTQSLLLFCAYALALHPEIQSRLRAEVDSVLDENDGEFTYDAINTRMTYLDMVINETLRFYPPAQVTDRCCTVPYKLPGTEFTVQKGNGIMIPIMGISHDEEYYPEPEKFNPERFSAENKGKINPYTFLSFGQGGRNCIGRRFALTEVKVAISHLVHNFKIEPSAKTLIPMKYSKSTSLKPEGGMFLALHKIQH